MAIPLAHSMEPHIDFVCCPDQLVWQPRAAAGAENDIVCAKSGENALVPPAGMPKFDDVTPGRVELGDDALQPGAAKVKARRELKEKAAHARTKEVGDMSEVADECVRSAEPFDVSDQFGNFDRVDKFSSSCLPPPPANRGWSGPGIKRGVEFDGPEMVGVMDKPIARGHVRSVKSTAPVPIEPTGTAHIDLRQVETRVLDGKRRSFALPHDPGGMHSRGAAHILVTLFGPTSFASGAALFSCRRVVRGSADA